MLNLRKLVAPVAVVLMAFSLTVAFVNPVLAKNDIDQKALDRAAQFLAPEQRGRDILGYVHAGANYRSHAYKETRLVNDAQGKAIPGQFAIVYTFKWENDGVTDVAFLCDAQGNVYRVQVVKTNAIFQQPFALANATIKVLGNILIEANKDSLTPAQLKDVQKLVDDADAKSMLEWSLKLQQALGK